MNNKYEMDQNMIKFDELIKVPIQGEDLEYDIRDQLNIDIDLDQSNKKINKRIHEQGEFNGEK